MRVFFFFATSVEPLATGQATARAQRRRTALRKAATPTTVDHSRAIVRNCEILTLPHSPCRLKCPATVQCVR